MMLENRTLYSFLQSIAAAAPDKLLIKDEDSAYTARELFSAVNSTASVLSVRGVHKGENILVGARRCTESVIAMLAVRCIGAVAVLTDPHSEPERFVGECSVSIPYHGVIVRPTPGCLVFRRGAESFSIITDKNSESLSLVPEGDGCLPGFIIFTSGSTGKNKAVVLSDMNLIANLIDSYPLGDYRSDDIALGAIPFEHVFGLVLLAGTVVHGYSMFIPTGTDVHSLLQTISREKITRMNGVPSLYLALAQNCRGYCIDSLRTGFIGGAPCTEEQFTYMETTLNMTLVPVYGMSECIGISCGSFLEPRQCRIGNVGRIYSMNTVRILLDDGSEAESCRDGEICVNSPARMLGYYSEPMPADALLHTGDIGHIDENGYLVLSGRKKDIIIRNGKNISPRRIETALLSLPGVSGAVVVGLPDEKVGELPYAMVCGIVDPAQLKTLLPKNELPAAIMCVEMLPMTASGKPDKVRIREVLAAWRNG